MFDRKRRELITLLGGAAAAWPLAARAQRAAKPIPRIGVLLFGTPETDPNLGAFRAGLRDLGYIEAQNIVLEYRYAEGKPERLRALARDLVAISPDLIFALGGDVAPLARAATSTIPIVMAVSNDPVEFGLVASLARPGGNITGVSFISSDLAAKRLQYLRELAPDLARAAVLWSPDHIDPEYREMQIAAKTLGIELQSLEVRAMADFDAAFASATSARSQALIPVSSRLMLTNRPRILQFATERQLLLAMVPASGPGRGKGPSLSYAPDVDATTRRAAGYVDKILQGREAGRPSG